MKNIKILLLVLSVLVTGNVSAASINNINAIDTNTIELISSEDVIFSDISVEGEVKLLKDIEVSYSAKDTENAKKVLINLSNELSNNSSYSLITILGADGNIDFSIGQAIEGEIMNFNLEAEEKGLEKINIIDSKTIELYFSEDLTTDTFEFKILNEINTNGLNSNGNNILRIKSGKELENSTNYIIMILSLEDVNGMTIDFNEDLHNFMTSDSLVNEIPEEIVNEIPEEIVDEGNVEEVALNSASTPETGTATGVLVFLAILLNLGFFFRKKLIK